MALLGRVLANLDSRELELAHLQISGRLVAGDREGVLPTLRGGDDVDAVAGVTPLDIGLRTGDLLVVDLEVADAGRRRGTAEDTVEGQQILAGEPGRAVHLHRGALGEGRRAGRITRGRARLGVGLGDAQGLQPGVLAQAL